MRSRRTGRQKVQLKIWAKRVECIEYKLQSAIFSLLRLPESKVAL